MKNNSSPQASLPIFPEFSELKGSEVLVSLHLNKRNAPLLLTKNRRTPHPYNGPRLFLVFDPFTLLTFTLNRIGVHARFIPLSVVSFRPFWPQL